LNGTFPRFCESGKDWSITMSSAPPQKSDDSMTYSKGLFAAWGDSIEVTSSNHHHHHHHHGEGVDVEVDTSRRDTGENDTQATRTQTTNKSIPSRTEEGWSGFSGLTKIRTTSTSTGTHGDSSTANETSSQDTDEKERGVVHLTETANKRSVSVLKKACAVFVVVAALAVAVGFIVSSSSKKKKDVCVPGQVADLNHNRLEIFLVGLSRPATAEEQAHIESTVLDSYNEVSKGCDDVYERWMYQTTLVDQLVSSTDDGSSRIVAVVETSVSCDDCPKDKSFASTYPTRRRRLEGSTTTTTTPQDRLVVRGYNGSRVSHLLRDLKEEEVSSISFAEVIDRIEANLQLASSKSLIEPGFKQVSDVTLLSVDKEEQIAFMSESTASSGKGNRGKGKNKSEFGCEEKSSKSSKSSKSGKGGSKKGGSKKGKGSGKTPSPSSSGQPSPSTTSAPSCSSQPTEQASVSPQSSASPKPSVSLRPTVTLQPTGEPSVSAQPSSQPSSQPSEIPSNAPSSLPSMGPTGQPIV
jgi:hypothetical protein